MIIASRRLYLLLILGVVPFCLAWFLPELARVGLVFDVVVLVALAVDHQASRADVSACRRVAGRLSIGRDNEVLLEVFNQGGRTLSLRVHDDRPAVMETDVAEFAFELQPRSRALLKYRLLPRTRGEFRFGNINVRALGRLGLCWRQVRVPAAATVRVYNDLAMLTELSVRLAHSSELGNMPTRRRGQGTHFASLREYVSGDDTRNIDWKATARRDRPVVRVWEVEKEQTLLVLVDAGRMMVSDLDGLSRFDHALNAALALALAGLHRNDQVGLGIFADRPLLYLPPRRGRTYFTRLVEGVCDIAPRTVEPDYAGALTFFAGAQKSRCLMVVLTDLTDPTGSQMLLSGLARLSPRHLPFCVTLSDRQIAQAAGASCPEAGVAFQRAVAADLLVQRDLAFSHLARRGCLVLDCPPRDLSNRLVERYLEIKAVGRL